LFAAIAQRVRGTGPTSNSSPNCPASRSHSTRSPLRGADDEGAAPRLDPAAGELIDFEPVFAP
jgi:hypothetical protein